LSKQAACIGTSDEGCFAKARACATVTKTGFHPTLQRSRDEFYVALSKDPTKRPDDRIGIIAFRGNARVDVMPSSALNLGARAIPKGPSPRRRQRSTPAGFSFPVPASFTHLEREAGTCPAAASCFHRHSQELPFGETNVETGGAKPLFRQQSNRTR